ncbi:MAG TPA: hypothetical protein PLC98_23440 [Anaerolineales bacterium]|nr:hypothetical protein [Anaerolineales bacterium]
MTVITTIISRACIAYASDSFLTSVDEERIVHVVETKQTKIVRVPVWKGLLSYWGLSRYPLHNWSTLDFLMECANAAHSFASPAAFADQMRETLTTKFQSFGVDSPEIGGLGIHFAAYEYVDGFAVPELFLISNFEDIKYSRLSPGGFHCTRETYHLLNEPGSIVEPEAKPHHADIDFRRLVYRRIFHDNKMQVYNNGDTLMFNPVAGAILDSTKEIRERGDLKDPDSVTEMLNLAGTAVSVVSMLQMKFVKSERQRRRNREAEITGKRRIGGATHAVAVAPNGLYVPQGSDTYTK